MGAPARFAQSGFRGAPARRQHRTDPRDLADQGRLRVVRAARREGTRPEPRARSPASSPRPGSTRPRSKPRTGRRGTRTPRTSRSCGPSRSRRRRVLRLAHHAAALRPRVRHQPDARPGELAPRDPREPAARGSRLLRPRSARSRQLPGSFVQVRARDDARRARRARAGPPLPRRGRPRHSGSATGRARPPRRRPARGAACGSSSSAPARPGRSPPGTSSSTAPRSCASSRGAAPTSCGSTRSGPTTRTASRAPRCTTALNVGKRNVTLNLKHPDAVDLVRRLVVEWADAVAENFAPRAMKGFGLDYDALAALRPDLVMISACLNGQTGPHKDYPGFGGQGCGAIGVQLAHRLARPGPARPARHDHRLARAPLRRYRARGGARVPASDRAGRVPRRGPGRDRRVRARPVAASTYQQTRTVGTRDGNRSPRAVPHGAFPCAAEGDLADRWVAIAAWDDADWAELGAAHRVRRPDARDASTARAARVDEIEAAVRAWTESRTRAEVCELLQARGVEAVPVEDFGDVHDDPQVHARAHFVALTHPVTGARALRAQRLPALRRAGRLRPGRSHPGAGQRVGARRAAGPVPERAAAARGRRRGRVATRPGGGSGGPLRRASTRHRRRRAPGR